MFTTWLAWDQCCLFFGQVNFCERVSKCSFVYIHVCKCETSQFKFICLADPGRFEFSKTSFVFKTSGGVGMVPVIRSGGTDGEVILSWRIEALGKPSPFAGTSRVWFEFHWFLIWRLGILSSRKCPLWSCCFIFWLVIVINFWNALLYSNFMAFSFPLGTCAWKSFAVVIVVSCVTTCAR